MAKVIVNDCYGQPTPSGWVKLVETLLFLIYQAPNPIIAPIQKECFNQVKRYYFLRHMPLRIDSENEGVWRGPKFIALDNKAMDFLNLLKKYYPYATGYDIPEMRKLSGTHTNLHTIVARTREIIEPFKKAKDAIYLQNKHGEGYLIKTEPDL